MKPRALVTLDAYGIVELRDPQIAAVIGGDNDGEQPTNYICHMENAVCVPPNIACNSNIICGE